MTPPLQPIVLIGAGNLATNLGIALKEHGFAIAQVYSRTQESAQALASTLQAEYTTQWEEIKKQAALYVVALKDSALVENLPQIVKGREKCFFVHTAGSISIDLWQSIPGLEHYGVLYPMQTFSKARRVDFRSVPLFIEASTPADTLQLKQLASCLSEKVQEATSQQRQALHLAAVFACNFSNHCYALAAQLLEEANLSFDKMLPLIDETARKVHQLSPLEAQSGPAVRFDTSVMKTHLNALENHPELQSLYRLMSESIQRNAEKRK